MNIFVTPSPWRLMLASLILASLSLWGVDARAQPNKAVVEIQGCTDPDISGHGTLTEKESVEGIKQVTVELNVKGLSDGLHAVHIHETGACKPCGAAKGHHDPGPFGQTRPDSATDEAPANDINHPFHMGDLINIDSRNGRATMRHTTNRVTLSAGRLSIFDDDGSAIIIHTNPDTYCDEADELKKGCAGGARDACGVIKKFK